MIKHRTFKIIKGFSEVLSRGLRIENKNSRSITIEFDDITMKTKLVVKTEINARRFVEKSFFSSSLGFTPHWDYKHYNDYISRKIINLSKNDKIQKKRHVIDGSVVNGLNNLYSTVSF